MSPMFTAAHPPTSTGVYAARQHVLPHTMYRQHQGAVGPLKALQTYSPRSEGQNIGAPELLQSLLNSQLASSVAGMADKAASQGAQQVRRLSTAASHLAAQALERVQIPGMTKEDVREPTVADMLSAGLPIHQSVGSALEQASYQTNAIQFKPLR